MGSLNPPARHLLALLENPDVTIDRVAAAIAVGVDRFAPPEFEPLQALDELALQVGPALDGPKELMKFVFGTLGFAPNATNYYALSNSLLHEVLDNRLGNPISLAAVAIALGHRLGVHLMPVGMPAHFLIGYVDGDRGAPARFFDPFAAGRELTVDECQQIFDAITPEASEFSPLMLQETPLPFVAGRMLANIKNASIRQGDILTFVATCEMVVGVPGAGVNEHRALSRALGSSGRHDRAVEVLEWLVDNDPENAEEHRGAVLRHSAHRN